MLKYIIAVFASFVVFASSAAIDRGESSVASQYDDAYDKTNKTGTPINTQMPKKIFDYNSYPSASMPMISSMMYPSYPNTYSMGSAYNNYPSYPNTYSMGSAYNNYPSASVLPYSSFSSANAYPYPRGQNGPSSAMKTVSHVRPYLYNTQPQVLVVPTSSYASQHIYQPYSQGGYSAGYPAYGYGYDSYSSLYKRDNEENEMSVLNVPAVQPNVNYQTTYIMKQPDYINDQPQLATEDHSQMLQPAPRSATEDNIIAYKVIPTNAAYSQFDDIHRNEVMVDDKMQLKISPNYLLKRISALPALEQPMSFSRATTDELQYGYPQGTIDPEDKVYIQYNPYSSEPNAQVHQQLGRAAEEPMYYPSNIASPMMNSPAMLSNMQLPPINNKYLGSQMPFSSEQIHAGMYQYFNNEYKHHLDPYWKGRFSQFEKPTDDVSKLSEVIQSLHQKNNEDIKKNSDEQKDHKNMKEDKPKSSSVEEKKQ